MDKHNTKTGLHPARQAPTERYFQIEREPARRNAADQGPHGDLLRDDGDLLTADEVALMLRMTKAWVYAQTRANRIPHLSLGRYVRYRRSAVLAWLGEIEQ